MKIDFNKYLGLVFIGIIVTILVIQDNSGKNDLKQGYIISSGKVVEYNCSRNCVVYVKFVYKGKSYKASTVFYSSSRVIDIDSIYNQKLNIVFLPENPFNSDVLLTEEGYEKYGLKMPDSMKWIYQQTYK